VAPYSISSNGHVFGIVKVACAVAVPNPVGIVAVRAFTAIRLLAIKLLYI
jgi:hypothetical protein